MKKPLMLQAAYLSGTWGMVTRAAGDESDAPPAQLDVEPYVRMHTYNYSGDTLRYCKFNETKRCILCGSCVQNPKK